MKVVEKTHLGLFSCIFFNCDIQYRLDNFNVIYYYYLKDTKNAYISCEIIQIEKGIEKWVLSYAKIATLLLIILKMKRLQFSILNVTAVTIAATKKNKLV
jgi:hypothetical protein